MYRLFQTVAFILLLSPSQVMAQDFDGGMKAMQNGDFKTALRNLKPLAEQGNADAENHLGLMYSFGWGVPHDDAEAVRWYRMAAEQGHMKAQIYLGNMYYNGRGVPEDHTEAVRWYRMAAEQGEVVAQFTLGNMYAKGQGVRQDNISAYMWFDLANENGESEGQIVREEISTKMTPVDISEAQRRATVCKASSYQDCD